MQQAQWTATTWGIPLLIAGLIMTGCSAAVEESAMQAPSESGSVADVAPSPQAAEAPASNAKQTQSVAQSANSVPRRQPQLIKNAELVISVTKVEGAIAAATRIIQRQQGDILGLEDQAPTRPNQDYTVFLKVRVPQAKLDTTLEALGQLGTIQQRSITAEDVSSQLVDYQARLKNLRKSEEMLLKIMERSGEISDVLQVSQEVSNVRESIEQIDAQLSDLQNRVAYANLSVTLEDATAPAPPQASLGTQLQESWSVATNAVENLTTGLLVLAVWLIAFSPYWLVCGGLGYLGYRRLMHQQTQRPLPTEPTPPAN